jgi:transposase
LAVDERGHRHRGAPDGVARSQWQLVWLLAGGMATAEVARVTGYSVNWVREIARRYREGGPAGIGDRRHGNPGAPPLLGAAQQAPSQEARAGPAPDGGLRTGRWVAVWMSGVLGRPVAPQRGWEWLGRLGFTPQRPRPRATRGDPEAQEASKRGGLPPPSPR